MEMNNLFNIFVPPLTIIALVCILPPFLVFNLLCSIGRLVFKENVAGKVVLITGASSGIGEHLAYEYGRRGARLALVARRTYRLQKVAARARELGSPDVLVITADVSKIEDCKRLVDKTVNHFGQLDHLVNNAGIASVQTFTGTSNISDLIPIMEINFWGSVYGTHFAVPHLRRSKGKIIVMSSAAAWACPPKASIYSASKAAQICLFETLRVELASEIGITIVTPGFVESEMTQGAVEEAKGKLQFLKNEPTDVCARAIVESACRGDMHLTEPFWMGSLFFLKLLCPKVWDWTIYRLFHLQKR